jgi:hypothetical protein
MQLTFVWRSVVVYFGKGADFLNLIFKFELRDSKKKSRTENENQTPLSSDIISIKIPSI